MIKKCNFFMKEGGGFQNSFFRNEPKSLLIVIHFFAQWINHLSVYVVKKVRTESSNIVFIISKTIFHLVNVIYSESQPTLNVGTQGRRASWPAPSSCLILQPYFTCLIFLPYVRHINSE